MTIAEPPEPLTFPHLDSIMNKQKLQEMGGPAVRHFGLFSIFCGLFISVHSCSFVVLSRYRLVPLKCGVICRAAAVSTADARDGSSYRPISANGIGRMAEHAVNGFHDSAENALS